ncbi:hypothetical protein LCGC14_1020450 [marine sediment metagenome]|uniref:Uncharacterized protein n=1 Tax=marine sediment metagenome TaxID=412755 RepID=A0A0F9MXK7_9ZZZZ
MRPKVELECGMRSLKWWAVFVGSAAIFTVAFRLIEMSFENNWWMVAGLLWIVFVVFFTQYDVKEQIERLSQ